MPNEQICLSLLVSQHDDIIVTIWNEALARLQRLLLGADFLGRMNECRPSCAPSLFPRGRRYTRFHAERKM
eukprot:1176327-Prorocentrum_minimum.AAC.4